MRGKEYVYFSKSSYLLHTQNDMVRLLSRQPMEGRAGAVVLLVAVLVLRTVPGLNH